MQVTKNIIKFNEMLIAIPKAMKGVWDMSENRWGYKRTKQYMQELESLESLSFELTTLLLPWISVLISIVFVFWFKDFATSLAKGLKFKQNPLFNEGDKVLLEGQDAIIVKIGLRSTVFGLYTDRGYTWRVIANERLEYVKLEKIIDTNVHMDSEAEQGKRIQGLIDQAQDDKIKANKERIDKLEK